MSISILQRSKLPRRYEIYLQSLRKSIITNLYDTKPSLKCYSHRPSRAFQIETKREPSNEIRNTNRFIFPETNNPIVRRISVARKHIIFHTQNVSAKESKSVQLVTTLPYVEYVKSTHESDPCLFGHKSDPRP